MTTPIAVCARNLSVDDASLLKSIFALRPERWNWTVSAEEAQWWVVDVDMCKERDKFPNSACRTVLALATDFSRMPYPHWTFIAKPLRSQRVLAVLDHHLARVSAREHPWSNSEVSLKRWPDMPRFKASPDLIYWCNELLHQPIAYRQLLATVPKHSAVHAYDRTVR